MKKTYYPLTSLFFALGFVFSQGYAWFNEIYMISILLPILLAIILVPILFYIFNFFLKDKAKTEIFFSLSLIVFFTYGAISSLSWSFIFTAGGVNLGKNDFQVFISLAVIAICFVNLYKTKEDLAKLKLLFFRLGLIIFIISLSLLLSKQVQRMLLVEAKSPLILPTIDTKIDKSKLPDIYFIEPEDYAAPSVFKSYFNYDESAFTTYLKNTGFYVADNATSNYPKTFESLASMLNMEYLDYLSQYKNSSDLTIVNPLIDNNNVMKFLKQFGYKYYQMGSWWGPTRYDADADDNFTLESDGRIGIDTFVYNLIDSTALAPIIDKIFPSKMIGDSDDDDRQRIAYQFNKLPQIVNLPGPKFIFAHIIAPHGPYVFGKDCEFINETTVAQRTEAKNYTNQTNCINQNLEKTINTIISTSKNPPVIILLTDEGVPFLNNELKPIDNWKTASDTLLQEKFPILSALYLPGVLTKDLYPSITPVNVFRIVFNLYFKANLPILSDKNYIFPNLNNLYQFIDVTSKVK